MKEISECLETDMLPRAFETTLRTNTKAVQSIVINESIRRWQWVNSTLHFNHLPTQHLKGLDISEHPTLPDSSGGSGIITSLKM